MVEISGIAVKYNCPISKPLGCALHCRIFIQILRFPTEINMCIWSVYLGKFERVFWGVHIVQGTESFKYFVNSY